MSADAAGLYRLIAETIPHMVWTARADGALDFFNRRCHEYTGFDSATLAGWGWKDVVHPEDWDRCLASWTRALQTGEQYEIEYRLRRADGVYRWFHGSAVPVRDGDGRPVRWFGTCTDIEAEVRSARILEEMVDERSRALRATEQRFHLFMEHLPGLAWIRDADLRYAYVNQRYRDDVGKSSAQLVGLLASDVYPKEQADGFLRTDLEVQRQRAPLHFVEDTHGRRWLKVKFPLPDASGRIGVAGIALDITERSRLEEDVRRLMDRLVVTQESERRRLADDLHDLIGQNLTALGIDLASMKQRLQAGDAGPAVAVRLDAMRALVEQTIYSIRGVMTDLRPPALEEYGLAPALRWYAAEFTERTGMKAAVTFAGGDRRLSQGAELALFRIVQEAMTNAAKHSGGTRVQICVAEEPGSIRLTVEDDGRGFADPVGARSARRGGWGLPAMRERAQAHGGELRIEFPGRGTRLIVDLPAGSGA